MNVCQDESSFPTFWMSVSWFLCILYIKKKKKRPVEITIGSQKVHLKRLSDIFLASFTTRTLIPPYSGCSLTWPTPKYQSSPHPQLLLHPLNLLLLITKPYACNFFSKLSSSFLFVTKTWWSRTSKSNTLQLT